MDLYRETVWDTPNDGKQYTKLEEADCVYGFLAGLNPKFDTAVVDRTNAMSILITLTIDSLPLALGPKIMIVARIMGSRSLCVSTARNNGTPRISVGNSMVIPYETKTPTLGTIAQSRMPQSLRLISVDGKNPWILDLRVTDHLTGSSKHFISYAPCVGHELGEDDWYCPT
ncbi:UBN2_3 domain-containing protein [Cucumis melo var. makuwa]|uniref:UBN2_3 domain-containing protein n=1 Tax=Cucumis melo var. makuwa TaxID=1194695 RepID=A0A5A7V597_CUCMM|nr:UBN2_3 domain-containing protein [Cucumis melo var. makuwa]TYK26558.1 UBN2_3 domain-containing protein [Cucumis melo var. makuwa]